MTMLVSTMKPDHQRRSLSYRQEYAVISKGHRPPWSSAGACIAIDPPRPQTRPFHPDAAAKGQVAGRRRVDHVRRFPEILPRYRRADPRELRRPRHLLYG